MDINESYKYIGVLASFLAWFGIAMVLYKWPTIKSNSISKHVSAYKRAWLLFAPIETISLLLFYLFMINWFIPTLNLPITFEVLVVAALLLELVTTWVTDTDGLKHKIHQFTAYTASLLIPVITLFIAVSPLASTTARVIAYLSFGVSVGIFCLFLLKESTREKHLVYQSLYFACFHLPILAVIFTT